VETASWSRAGQLVWWVKKNGRNGGVAYAVLMAANDGSELLIFARPEASDSTVQVGEEYLRGLEYCGQARIAIGRTMEIGLDLNGDLQRNC
jgi:hypothetical protein